MNFRNKLECLLELEMHYMDKHSSLFRELINYGRKKFYNIYGQCCNYFYGPKLRLFMISWSVCP
jgi:hypothetical protein